MGLKVFRRPLTYLDFHCQVLSLLPVPHRSAHIPLCTLKSNNLELTVDGLVQLWDIFWVPVGFSMFALTNFVTNGEPQRGSQIQMIISE